MSGNNGRERQNGDRPQDGAGRWAAARSILCVRLDSIGDTLMSTPAIRAVKESVPGGRVTLLTSPSGAEVARMVPEIDDILVYEAPWMKATRPPEGSAYDLGVIERLGSLGFDGAIIFTVYSQNPLAAAFLCYLAGIPLRLAYCRENPYHLLTDWRTEEEPFPTLRHEVVRQLELVGSIGWKTANHRLSLAVPADAEGNIPQIMRRIGIDEAKPFVLIHPGATAPSRRYPAAGFAELGRHCAEDLGLQVLFTGTDSERTLVETVRRQMRAPSSSLAGCLSLPELAAVISRARLLVTNNTGPAHMAAALGVPVVSLYALTNPQHVPWHVPHRVLFHDVPCKFCYKSVCPQEHHDCLRLLPPSEVSSAISDLLSGNIVDSKPSAPLELRP